MLRGGRAVANLRRMNTPVTTRPPYVPQIRLYQDWLQAKKGLSFPTYHALWRWSITDLDAFWQSIWDYFDMESPTPHTAVLAKNVMPGAVWFPGARTNYAHQVLRHVQPAHAAGFAAIISRNEKGQETTLSWPELRWAVWRVKGKRAKRDRIAGQFWCEMQQLTSAVHPKKCGEGAAESAVEKGRGAQDWHFHSVFPSTHLAARKSGGPAEQH